MSEINTVNVLAIGEEKLKFRVTATFAAPQLTVDEGEYKFLLPIPTSLTNSHEYNSCVIQCNGFQAYTLGATADPTWTIPGALGKVGTIELHLDIPSSQTTTTTSLLATHDGVGNSRVGGYRELIFLDCHSVGDGAGNVVLGGRSAAWTGKSTSDPILCGNPFGNTITIRNTDPVSDDRVWLVSAAGGAGGLDIGHYIYSFDITMVKNN
jgi:hypothetical protein